MDNKTRAEKIVGFIIDFDGDLIDVVLRDFIISQLDEVVREAVDKHRGDCDGECARAFASGFRAAREKAAGIAENFRNPSAEECVGVCNCDFMIACSIRKMEA